MCLVVVGVVSVSRLVVCPVHEIIKLNLQLSGKDISWSAEIDICEDQNEHDKYVKTTMNFIFTNM